MSEDDGGRRRRISRGGEQRQAKRLKKATSPSTAPKHDSTGSNAAKRRGSAAAHAQGNQEKRARSSEGVEGDATRTYIFKHLMDIIRSIFEDHARQPKPKVEDEGTDQDQNPDEDKAGDTVDGAVEQPSRSIKELNDEEKTTIEEKTTNFVSELEGCMLETYGEPDKTGNQHAGAKYK